MTVIAAIIVAYLCGSIPSGLLLARAAGLGDIRKIGSGNIGATNVLRTGNKKIAALTLIADVLKGLIPVFLFQCFAGPSAAALAGFAVMAGHIFPVWLNFKGGKGVATAFGVLIAWSWVVALIGIAVWISVFAISRISSLSALSAALLAVPAAFFLEANNMNVQVPGLEIALWPAILILAIVVWVTHRANIRRLLKGAEPKTTFSAKT